MTDQLTSTAHAPGSGSQPGWTASSGLALLDILRSVRSRRIGLGYRIDTGTTQAHPATGRAVSVPRGPREFASAAPPVPLSDTEEALLAWAACGPNGQATWDRSRVAGFDEPVSSAGHTAPHAGGSPASSLVVINDQGAVVYRPGLADGSDVPPVFRDGCDPYQELLGWYQGAAVRILDHRLDIDHALGFPGEPPLPAMGTYQHNINMPGSTWFLPVTDCGQLGASLLTSFGTIRTYPVDEFNGGRPCGLDDLVADGTLHKPIPISQLELSVFQAEHFPAGCIVQNVRLAAEAIGLGHWCICGYSQETLLGASLELTPGLGFHCELVNPRAPVATGALKIFGIRDVIEATYVPSPRFATADQLVDAWWRRRFAGGVPSDDPAGQPWVREACTRYVDYCVRTFGQWPVTYNPMQARFSVVVHHLDPAFYDRYYPDGSLTTRHRQHMGDWHTGGPRP